MNYSYTYVDVLGKFTPDFFNSMLGIKNPAVLSPLSLKRVHRKPLLHKIQDKIDSLTVEEKEELIGELLSILPSTDTSHTYTEAENTYRKKRFAKYEKYFSDIDSQFNSMRDSERKLIITEALVGIDSTILKIRNELPAYAVESDDTEPYMLMEQIFSICQTLIENSLKILKSKAKKEREIQFSMFLVLTAFLNLEAVKRGTKKIDSLYDLLAILSSAADETTETKEIDRRAYEVFNLTI